MEAVHSLVRLLQKLELLESEPHKSTYEDKPELPIRLLAKLGRFDEGEAIKSIAEHLDILTLDLSDKETRSKINISQFQGELDSQLCWQKKAVPLWKEKGRIWVAMANPLDLDGLQSICFPLPGKGSQIIAAEKDILTLLRENIPPSKVKFDSIDVEEEEEGEDHVEILGNTEQDVKQTTRQSESKPIIRLCNKLVADAHRMGASDVHLQPIDGALEVKFRIDGIMHSIMEVPGRLQPAVISRLKLLSGMDIADHRRAQDGRFGVRIDEQPLDVRVSCVPTTFGENLVLRLLNNDCSDLTFEGLGLSERQTKGINRVLESRGRMFLVTGPTGSGKTTTLYTCLNKLRDGTVNIETVEDPIEYRIPGIQQIQVNESADITFASALRTILRQDPDVIMIGEIRDEETAKIALQAAQTGHLVLSTLHTNDAPSAITRLFDLNAPSYLVSSSLAGVLAQRLVRTICPHCKSAPGEEYLAEFAEKIIRIGIDSTKLNVGVGCEACHYTGYRGRTALYSYLEVNHEMERLIHDRESPTALIETARENGFMTLEEHALMLLEKGTTTFYEVDQYFTRSELGSEKRDRKEDAAPPVEMEKPKVKPAAEPGVTFVEATSTEPEDDLSLSIEYSPTEESIRQDRVLLIEDDPDVRSILSLLLQKEMYEVIEAENGLDGLKEVYEKRPALVVADLMMPKMDGKEFLIKMKNNQKTVDIPVLILTAASSEENEVELLNLGANDFVRKGSASEVFLSRVRRALAEAQK